MNKRKPKVSICIPTYKQLEFLKITLDSIVFQTYTDYEIIVSDDTPDNTVTEFLKNYNFGEKLKYFKNERSLGSPENWNQAIRHANGEYIKIMHHDDWFTFNYSLEEFVKMLDKNPQADFAFSASQIYHADTLKTRIHCISQDALEKIETDPLITFFANYIGAPSATIFRKKVNKSFDINMKWLVDLDFYIQILNNNPHIIFNNNHLITTSTGTSHAITNECISNKEVEIFEHLHLFEKIRFNIKEENYNIYINYLWELFKRHGIKTQKEIGQLGYTNDLPTELKWLFYMKRCPRALFKIYQKITLPQRKIKSHPYYTFN